MSLAQPPGAVKDTILGGIIDSIYLVHDNNIPVNFKVECPIFGQG